MFKFNIYLQLEDRISTVTDFEVNLKILSIHGISIIHPKNQYHRECRKPLYLGTVGKPSNCCNFLKVHCFEGIPTIKKKIFGLPVTMARYFCGLCIPNEYSKFSDSLQNRRLFTLTKKY